MTQPKFQLYITTDNSVSLLDRLEKRFDLGGLTIAYSLNDNIVTKYEDMHTFILLLGHVIMGDRIDNDAVIGMLRDNVIGDSCKDFNGLWLIIQYDKANKRLTVINDRYASYPLYYNSRLNDLHLSLNYLDIFDSTARSEDFDKHAFYEFLTFRRILGEKTYDKSIAYVRGASKLVYDPKGKLLSRERYWNPSFEKLTEPQNLIEERLINTLEKSVRSRLTDGKRYGVLLSGGVDSRLVLMMANKPMTAFTNCDWMNNEYDVAHEVAERVGCEHVFVKRPDDYYEKQKKMALQFTGGMYPLYEAGWLIPNYYEPMFSKIDAMLHGCGFDYLVGDNYLPVKKYRFLGHDFYKRKLRRVRGDLIDDFMGSISWRFKDFASLDWFGEESREDINGYLRAQLTAVVQEAEKYTDDELDKYLYITIHNPSRHFMYFSPMMIRAYVDERCPGWDNDYFEFCLSLPHKYRSNWWLYRKALSRRYSEYMRIRDANTNLSAGLSPLGVDLLTMRDGVLRKCRIKKHYPPNNRSWPVMKSVRTGPFYTRHAESIIMDALPELSLSKVREVMGSDRESIAKNILFSTFQFLERSSRCL